MKETPKPDAPPDAPPSSDSKLARAGTESDKPIARLADPSTQLGFTGDMLAALEATVSESSLTPTMKLYLKRFAKYGYKGKACAAADVSLSMPSLWRKHEEWGQEFAAVEAVIQDALVEQLEESVDARAFLGYLEPVFGSLGYPEVGEDEKGKTIKYTGIVGYKRMFDSQLAQFRLKALAPEKYAERRKTELTGPGGGPLLVSPVVDRLTAQLAKLNEPKPAEVETVDAPDEPGS